MSTAIQLDRDGKTAIYQQIAGQLREQIVAGRLPAGAQLPTIRRLAAELGVTRLTVQTAYAELQSGGWIESTVGRGSFVAARLPAAPAAATAPVVTVAGVIGDILQIGQGQGGRSFASASPDPALFPADEFWACLNQQRGALEMLVGYGPGQGDAHLRMALAGVLAERGVAATAAEIVVTAGVTQALALVIGALTQPGDVVLVEQPTYIGFLHQLRMTGLQAVGVPLDEEGVRPDVLERLAAQMRPRFLYTIPSFQNPTGVCASAARRRQVLELAQTYGFMVVEDDIYGLLDICCPNATCWSANSLDSRMNMNPIGVTLLTARIVELFESSADLRDIWVTGEVSNWKKAASGHIYFRLKDTGATINAVMWKGQASAQSWLPRDGDQVLAHGYVGVYPEGGAYQLYANILRPAGRGQLFALFEQLKERLEAEGLFAPERKRAIPDQPRRLGIVTSADAAALRDILRTLNARWPLAEVVIFHTLVQGADAPAQIAAAIALANRCHAEHAPLDALILARGGGSIEDLWAFNDEQVAYAIYHSALPIISGVGHETDTTIADFVADLSAPTPTGAAVAATPDRAELIDYFQSLQAGFVQQALGLVNHEQSHLGQRLARLKHFHPRRRLDVQWQSLDDRTRRLHSAILRRLDRLVERRASAEHRLEALNPSRVLERGYSIVLTPTGAVVLGPNDAPAGAHLTVRAAQGSYSVVKED